MRLTGKILLLFCPVLAFAQQSERWPPPGALDELYESGDADALVTGGILLESKAGKSQYAVEDFFVTALESDPSHRLAAHSLISYCAKTATVEICKSDNYLNNVAASDATNGAMWAAYAALKDKHGDSDEALALFRYAADAAAYGSYLISYMTLFDGLLSEQAALSSANHASLTLSFSTRASNDQIVFELCKRYESREWTDARLRLGRKIENGGRALVVEGLGLAMQMVALERREDDPELPAIEERFEKTQSFLTWLKDPSDFFEDDDDFWRQWLDTFIEEGERSAIRLAEERTGASTPLESESERESKAGLSAQVSEGMNLATAAKAAAAEFFVTENRMPVDRRQAGMTPNPGDTHGRYVESVDIVSGVVVITYGNEADSSLHGLTIAMAPYATANRSFVWVCGYAAPPPGLVPLSGATQAPSTMPPDLMPAPCQP